MAKMYFKKIETDGEILIKCLDSNGNYSLASNLDPTPDGYTDHRWEDDADLWIKISEEEADSILENNVTECGVCSRAGQLTPATLRATWKRSGDTETLCKWCYEADPDAFENVEKISE